MMKMSATTLALFALLMCGVVNAAPTQWRVQDGGNGHSYEIVAIDPALPLTWEQTKSAAEAMTFLGVRGHLATVTSQPEQNFIEAMTTAVDGYGSRWNLGGYQDLTAPDYLENDKGWRWVTGEQWGYTNWQWPSTPDNSQGIEHWLLMVDNGPWQDGGGGPMGHGHGSAGAYYFVEYPIPEPATLSLLALVGLAMIRRRRH